MARALLVGCGYRAREVGADLLEAGWAVRGTSRTPEGVAAIEAAGIEAVEADPDRVGTVLEHVGDVTVLAWLLASATGEADSVAALHGPRLERLLEHLVDTPVRGVAYEAAGTAPDESLAGGRGLLTEAGERWRIPGASIEADPADRDGWRAATLAAITGFLG